MAKSRMLVLFVPFIVTALILSSCTPPNELEQKSVAELIPMLKDEDSVIRAKAVMALGTKKEEAKPAIPDMIKLLGDKKAHVRNRAMDALAKIGGPAVKALLEATHDRDRIVRFYAAHALKKIPGNEAKAGYDAWIEVEGKDIVSEMDR